jgi:hypothetical protein
MQIDYEGNQLMTDVEKIQSAETKVAEMQDALAAVQYGLQKAEEIALATEQIKERANQLLKVTLGLIGLSIVLIVVSRRRPR